MRALFLWIFTLILSVTNVIETTAQTHHKRMRSKVDSVLAIRYSNTPYDTNYVVRPEGMLTLKVRLNHTGNTFHAKGTINDVYAKANVSTEHKNTLSLAAIYRGIGCPNRRLRMACQLIYDHASI